MGAQDPDPAAEADCCVPRTDPRIARHFDHKMRQRMADGALPALHDVSAHLLEQLSDVAEERPSLLELGCGSGALGVELLRRGATRLTGIDLSPASVDAAIRRAANAGVTERATFQVADASLVPLEAHDWVVLDRVLCCYRDLGRLMGNSIPAARRRYAFSVPDSRGLAGFVNRIEEVIEAVVNTLRGRPCPGYVHDLRLIEGRLAEAGFAPVQVANAGRWYLAVFERRDASR